MVFRTSHTNPSSVHSNRLQERQRREKQEVAFLEDAKRAEAEAARLLEERLAETQARSDEEKKLVVVFRGSFRALLGQQEARARASF